MGPLLLLSCHGAERGCAVGRIRDETSVQELKIREVDTRIESEIAGLRTAIETAKVRPILHLGFRPCFTCVCILQQSTLQYLVTVGMWQSIYYDYSRILTFDLATGCAALLMAYLRFRV